MYAKIKMYVFVLTCIWLSRVKHSTPTFFAFAFATAFYTGASSEENNGSKQTSDDYP